MLLGVWSRLRILSSGLDYLNESKLRRDWAVVL